MGHHKNTLLSSDERINKVSNTDHTDKIILVNTKDKFFCHFQFIMTSRYQGRKLVLDISRIFIDYDSNTISYHMNALLPGEGINKAYKHDIYMDYKPYLFITQFAKYLFNNPFNLNLNTPSSNLSCKGHVKSTTLPQYTLPK